MMLVRGRRSMSILRRFVPTRAVAAAALVSLVASGVSASQPVGSSGEPDPNQDVQAACTDATPVSDPVTTPAAAATSLDGPPDFQGVVQPTDAAPRRLSYAGATLVIKPSAVRLPVGVGITPLAGTQVRPLDAGMTNVTRAPQQGYRFTPHPMRFAEDVTVSLPYDPALLPDGFTAQDVYTYYFDESGSCWRPLERIGVDEDNHLVTSSTNHFTDMINATVVVPEHPEGESFDPNQIKGIQAADPAAGITLIAPPAPNNQGENQLSYRIEVPPGRDGLQPQLAVSYDSAGPDGWLGLGWDVPLPAVTIDTRWGVPRYAAGQETETYLLNGEQLAPVANRGALVARTGERVFHTRVEGQFARIVRHGASPSTYSWEITDKAGRHWSYGGGTDSTLTDAAGNIGEWALREVRDSHGNLMRYHTVRVSDPGVDGGGEPGSNLYLQRITWTGEGGAEGRYAVTFVRDRELGEPLRVDKGIDARSGFKRVTADLLRRVDVTLDSTLIRRYQYDYTTGAFAKTLLSAINQYDADGALFSTHRLDYYDDIRDAQGQYQAFEQVPWNSPGDGLRNGALNLTPDQAGDASALSASTSTAAGGHLYVGVGPTASKTNSVGVKTGFDHSADESLLALVDVDGDTLPDKVFRKGGTVFYRKNLAAQARFSDQAVPLNLPGIGAESSDSLTLGAEAYPGAVAAQLDYVNTFATTDQYFSDVNGDGITDLVNGSTVLFGRIGTAGTPVYGVSADTPVPVTSGPVDGGVFGGFGTDQDRLNDSFPLLDTVRRWIAPYDGVVRVTGPVRLSPETAAARAVSASADGVRVAVQHENDELWAERIGPRDDAEHSPSGVDAITVHRGDRLYFRVQSLNDGGLDEVSWDPAVGYLDVPATTDVNGLEAYTYQASRDFTLGGRTTQVKVPLTGTLHLTGDLRKKPTTDDVAVVITRDGEEVFNRTLPAATDGGIPLNIDVPVHQGQTLRWRVAVDSPVDLGQLAWAPHGFYTAADGVDQVTDDSGNPLFTVDPPYDVDMYPVDGLTAPQGFRHIAADGTITVAPRLAFGTETSARVAFTVKRRGELLVKRTFDARTVPEPFTVDVRAGDDLFFDFSTTDPTLRDHLTAQSVEVDGEPAPSAFHSSAVDAAFPQPYRGWGAIGYNGNKERAAQPIAQQDLVLDEHIRDQVPTNVDPQAQQEEFARNPKVDPPKIATFSPQPARQRWAAGDHSFVTADAASSSRLGAQSVGLPTAAGLPDRTAVPRMSRSQQISLTGGVGLPVGSVGGSVATGDSTGQLDFIDLNGDQFPDVVGADGIQYTDANGSLGGTRGDTPDGAVRRSSNAAGNASAGSAARTIPTGRGYASPPADATANTAAAGNDMPPLGIGGNLGTSRSDGAFDLLDINGDGLPDRVYDDGRVRLNLGYRFGAPELWRNPAPLNKGSGSSAGISLGFNTDFYGFAGGLSYSQASSSTSASLMDMNGDGLLDRVFAGNPIQVALNTGNGFQPAVPFHGSLSGLNGDQNAKLGGGVYFEVDVCVFLVAVCIIINPGASVSTGASRTEQALRDINGDGYADQLASRHDNQLQVAQNRTGRTNLLRSVARPLGGRMDFGYTRDGNTYDLPQSRWVLSSVAVDDGHAGDGQDVQEVSYDYRGGAYDRLEREFDGYATVIQSNRDRGAGDAVFRTVTRQYRTDGHYTRGLLARELTADAAGHPFVETRNTYQLQDLADPTAPADPRGTTATVFPALVRTDNLFYEGQATPGKSTFTTMDYDAFGNVVRQFDAADSGPADDVDTRVRYTADDPACQDTFLVGLPRAIDVTGGGTLMRHRESTVDCTTGDVTQVRSAVGGGQTAVTDLTYFANGNLRSVTNPPNERGQRFRLDYTYDSTVDTHVESVTDSFGLRSTTTHDLRFGEVSSSTDTNNQVVRDVYDAAGRLIRVTGPYEAAGDRATIEFEYHPEAAVPYAVTRHVDRTADGSLKPDTIDTVSFVDGLGRTIQTKKDATLSTGASTPAQEVMTVSGQVVWDFLGRPVQERYPTTEPKGAANTTFNPAVDTVAPTRLSYDVLDRTTRTVLPDQTVSTVDYGFGADRSGATQFELLATDGNGKTKRTYVDVRHLTTSVKEFNPAGGQPVIWTSYRYDPLRELTAVVDDRGSTTTAAYDNLGRRTIVDSPDAGRTSTTYDLADHPIRKVTATLAAQGKAISYGYDFDHLTAVRYPVFTANNVTYSYGAPGAANNTAGRIASITDGAGTLSREYGPLGETTKETRTTPADGLLRQTFTTQYRYDTWNRLLSMTYPDGEVLSYGYDSGGQVSSASGVKGRFSYPYLTRLEYDKFGERAVLETGNGTRTEYTHNAADRRLANQRSTLAQGYAFQNLNYSYDNVGNITSLSNDVAAPPILGVGDPVGGPGTQTFRYDDLYQLTHAEGSYSPRGPISERYTLDLSYDSTHNITGKDQLDQQVVAGHAVTIPFTTYDHAYSYDATQPHAPDRIGPNSFAYDAAGNQISRATGPVGVPRRQLVWDEENRLECSHEVAPLTLPQTPAGCALPPVGTPVDVQYRYDDGGNRVVKDSGLRHVYPNRDFSTSGVQQFKHIYVGETKLLTKFVQPQIVREDLQFYSHTDQLGSTGYITDRRGGLAEHLEYFPGGETRISEDAVQPVPQQFTGKEFDPETNLYYYGARYYDPRTQVWQSPDPLLGSYLDGMPNNGVYQPFTLAAYTYAFNNPVRLSDPNGLDTWNRVVGGLKLVGGFAEAGAGATLGVATSWTGIGAVAGGVAFVHGADVAASGLRQLWSGENESSITSMAIQRVGISKDKADFADSTMSVVATAGAGALVQSARLAAVTVPELASSRLLGANMQAAGTVRPVQSAAHHIVAGGDARAATARAVLQRFGIGINEAENGVFLPRWVRSANANRSAVHAEVHTDAYYAEVNRLLGQAQTREEVVQALDFIRGRLLAGRWP